MKKTLLSSTISTILAFLTISGISMIYAQTDIAPVTPTIQITSHTDGQQIPTGELVIEGISSDSDETNCQVYADVNDISPLQNATAEGPDGEDDFSEWSFEYTSDYQLINPGDNELTAKISCFDNGPQPVSEWHSVNVTGIGDGEDIGVVPSPSLADESSPLSIPTIETDEESNDTEDEGDDDEEGEDESP